MTVRLATMGSPFTYLYQHYYPARYPKLFDAKGQMAPGWVYIDEEENRFPDMALDKTVDQWINLYRVDDFIGMRIEGRAAPEIRYYKPFDPTRCRAEEEHGAFPENVPVGPGGHTNYWNAERVLDELRRVLPV
jgi:hypothetical protein